MTIERNSSETLMAYFNVGPLEFREFWNTLTVEEQLQFRYAVLT